ncbi:uncharacterized protein LY79DRAFT_523411 [Colletotrichum navitas]|uniref:Uncharacterized protein n=1 Tax=Colletotrichum navitas TaxID=681940 RepID=A0AAD8PR05_9PEZI|nr:uncharacterized protein LY79DRAFT_523411 [Colletotrichum navitas]KAK1574696.1 hypothetical protein LY79DRAFT_523411 [Colletotrichum navitas]
MVKTKNATPRVVPPLYSPSLYRPQTVVQREGAKPKPPFVPIMRTEAGKTKCSENRETRGRQFVTSMLLSFPPLLLSLSITHSLRLWNAMSVHRWVSFRSS